VTCAACGEGLNPSDLFCEACGEPTDLFTLTSAADSRKEEDHGATAAVSDRGRVRARNEDAYAVAAQGPDRAVVVCDGVATTNESWLAAAAAARAAMEQLRLGLGSSDAWTTVMGDAIRAAQAVLSTPSDEERTTFEGSTTIVAALARSGHVVVGNVGDSRAYWIGRNTPNVLLSRDDTWVREARENGISEDEVRVSRRAHEITAWLGPDLQRVDPHVVEIRPSDEGVVVVCSDGLWNYAESPDSIAALVAASDDAAPVGIARHLVQFALEAGGGDNVTVAVADTSTFRKENGIDEEEW
jgi:serine/threonine protein phosphatase PrpC